MMPIVYEVIIKEAPDAITGAKMLDNAMASDVEVKDCEMHQREDGSYYVSWKVPRNDN